MDPKEWLAQAYPWTKRPLITNAPMASLVSPEMVYQVTRAGGLGFLGAGYDIKSAEERLRKTRDLLGQCGDDSQFRSYNYNQNQDQDQDQDRDQPSTLNPLVKDSTKGQKENENPRLLPIGIGVLCFAISLDEIIRVCREYKPAIVWLFAAHNEADYATWAERIRNEVDGRIHIWVQTNSVENALNLLRTAKPDVLVMQGSDAGGHGPIKGAGVLTLLPETKDALFDAGFGHLPLVAAGGIVDGRGVAAALVLGASAVTLGTRFIAAEEAAMPDKVYQKMILDTKDGGQTTTRSQIFDEVQFADGNVWPVTYDGRALRNAMVTDAANGVALDEARKLYATDKGFKESMAESRAVAWAGTGVGLVKKVEPSFKIITDVRASALEILKGFSSSS